MATEVPNLEIHYDDDGEWAALYVGGGLKVVGDKYLAEEEALELAGVKVVHDAAFLRGQGQRDGVARTLDQVAAYAAERDARAARAADLREQARALEAEADAIERSGA